MQKILEQNGIETENIDGAGFNNFTAGNRDGIIKGILNECTLYQPSSNSIAINTGEIIIKGFRIKIVDTEVKTFSSLPAMPEKWHIVARVELYSDSTLIGGLLFRNETTLIQDDLLKNEQGIYEAEVGEFVLSTSGVSDIVRTMKVIVGGTNASGESGKIEANPPQEPTEELKKLSVGDTTYSVVSSTELNKKLDKVSTTFPDVDRAYIIKPNGTQSTLQVTKWYPTPNAIVLRDEKGYAKAFTPLNDTPNIYHLINYEYFTAKAMPKMYRHIIRMSFEDDSYPNYNEIVFAIESSRNTKYTLENDCEELRAELQKYGAVAGLLPSALYAVMYHSDIPEVPLQIFISDLQDNGFGVELYFIVGGGDDMAEITALTDEVYEI